MRWTLRTYRDKVEKISNLIIKMGLGVEHLAHDQTLIIVSDKSVNLLSADDLMILIRENGNRSTKWVEIRFNMNYMKISDKEIEFLLEYARIYNSETQDHSLRA